MKIRPLGAEMFHAVGQTDVTKVIVTFRNFANAPRKDSSNHIHFLQWLGLFPLLQYSIQHDVSETTCFNLVVLVLWWSVCVACGVSSAEDDKI